MEARAADGKRLVVGCGRAACRYAHREHAIDVQLVHAILDEASTQMRPRVERHRGAVLIPRIASAQAIDLRERYTR